MPSGVYERTEYHRQRISDGLNDDACKKARKERRHTEESKKKMRDSWTPERKKKIISVTGLTRKVRVYDGCFFISLPSQLSQVYDIKAGDTVSIEMTRTGFFISKMKIKDDKEVIEYDEN